MSALLRLLNIEPMQYIVLMNATRRSPLRTWSRTGRLQLAAAYLAYVAVMACALAAYGWALTNGSW